VGQTATPSALEISSLTKSYACPDGTTKVVLDDISFSVEPGEFVSIFGPNGCGKTTLLKVVAGLESHDSGRITRGWEVGEDPAAPGVVFQNCAETLLPWSTAAENVAFPLLARGAPRAERLASAKHTVESLGLRFDASQYPYKLSGGQQQSCCIARAMVHTPSFLLLDEPFSALDHEARRRIQKRVLDIWAETRPTVMMVTHDLDEAILLASRFILLEGLPGRIGLDIPVELPYPRGIDLMETPEFYAMRKTILGTIRRDLAT